MNCKKGILSFALVLALILSLSVTAAAANTHPHTITITNEQPGHVYTAYQIFAGDLRELDGEKVLTDLVWGTGVDGAALLAELQQTPDYAACTGAEDVAAVLSGFGDSSAQLDAFAAAAAKHLASAAGSSAETASPYRISVTGDGYYLIRDTGTLGPDDAATKYILRVVEDTSVAAKADTPHLDKVIENADSDADEDPADGNTDGLGTAQDVGSAVVFRLTSAVPRMDGYDSYTYLVSDTLSDGLTFNRDVAVTIGGAPYPDFDVQQSGQSFTITFNHFIDQKPNAGQEIVITYSATINEKALETDVETNTAHLVYSNNPADSASHGQTPDEVVHVYDFDLVIDKFTGQQEGGARLQGAMFVLKNAEGRYYRWNAETKAVEWTAVAQAPDVTNLTPAEIRAAWEALNVTVAETDAQGAARFRGIDAGTYALQEIAAPAGYNLLKQDVPVTITATYNQDGTLKASSAVHVQGGQYAQTQAVENRAGTELPETGGMGTGLFYGLGAALALGAAAALVTRRAARAA